MASVDANLTALDNQNVMADQIIRVAKVHLQTISGATVLQKEIGTKTYIINRIFQSPCLFVAGYQTVVNWIDSNFDAFLVAITCSLFYTDIANNEGPKCRCPLYYQKFWSLDPWVCRRDNQEVPADQPN